MIVIIGFTTVLVMVLLFALSLRLRQNEIETIIMIGCSRMTAKTLKGVARLEKKAGASYPAEANGKNFQPTAPPSMID